MRVEGTEWQRFHTQLADGGSLYAETNLNHIIVEPWNALSSLVFLLPAIYWAYKIRKEYKDNLFICLCVILLSLGGIGSTLFHAFRSSSILLWMDVLPILVLTLAVSTFFWQKLFKNIWVTVFIVAFTFFMRRFVVVSDLFSAHTATNVSYFIGGTAIFLPLLLVLAKTGFSKLNIVVISILLFCLALFFREIDARDLDLLPMGTHFLWHIFCAWGAYYLAKYIYAMEDVKPETTVIG